MDKIDKFMEMLNNIDSALNLEMSLIKESVSDGSISLEDHLSSVSQAYKMGELRSFGRVRKALDSVKTKIRELGMYDENDLSTEALSKDGHKLSSEEDMANNVPEID